MPVWISSPVPFLTYPHRFHSLLSYAAGMSLQCNAIQAGPCVDGDDIENIPLAQTVRRAEKTLAPVPTQGPFTKLTYMPRQKLFIGWSVERTPLSSRESAREH